MISCGVKNVSLFTSRDFIQGRRNSGRAGEGSTKVEGNINLEKENRYQLCLFLFSNDVDPKNNTRNYRKPSEVPGCANNCNTYVSVRSW